MSKGRTDARAGTLAGPFTEAQAAALDGALRALEERLATRAELARLEGMLAELLARTPPSGTPGEGRGADHDAAPTPEEVAIVAAAVTAFLGKHVRVRGVRRLSEAQPQPAAPASSAWGHQGRVFIHASHGLAGWGRFGR
jgi:hypothetical protein